jgi:ankyrin repeat protein
MANKRLRDVICIAAMIGAAGSGVLHAASTLQAKELPRAAMQGDREAVRQLLRQNADLNAAQGDGMTALHWAASRNDVEMGKMLLAAGANLKSATRIEGLTPLAVACTNGSAAMVELLLSKGADANLRGELWTPLMLASASGSTESVKLLLDHGADVNAKESSHHQTALMFAAGRDRASVVSLLATHGADLNITSDVIQLATVSVDENGNRTTPAANGGAANDRAKARVMGGMTALHFAARDNQKEAVRALVEAGADLNVQSPGDKGTPLVIAITNGHYDVAKYLVDHGANPNLATADGLAALYATIDCQWKPVAWEPTPRVEQDTVDYLTLLKDLLDHGAYPDVKLTKKLWFRPIDHDGMWVKYSGTTPFWRAAQATDVDAMKLLVAHGADPKVGSDQKDTPLAMAAGVGWTGNFSQNAPESFVKATKYLVEEIGLDVNTQDVQGYTPLMGASYRGDNDTVRYLVEHGAKMDLRNEKGWSATDMANGPCCFAIGGSLPPPHPETVSFLLKLGAPALLPHEGEETLGVNDKNKRKNQAAKKAEDAATDTKK